MTVSQVHEALGNWSIKLKPNIPRDVLDNIEYFGHIAIIPGRLDARVYGDSTLDSARYVGVVRKKKIENQTLTSGNINTTMPDVAGTAVSLSGPGMNFWLGDEDDKGDVIEDEIQLTDVNFSTAISGLLPPAVTMGNVGGVSGTYSGIHQWQTPRKAIQYVCQTMSQAPSPFNLLSDNNSSFESTGAVGGWVADTSCAIWDTPQLRGTGTYASGTGNITPGLPSGYQANDIFILSVEFDSTNTPSFSIPGWTQIGSTIRTATASGTGTGMANFWKRATATETAPTITDTGDHTSAVIQAFSGCKTSGSPINVFSQDWNDSAGTSVAWDTVTTTVDNCLVLYIGTHGVDTATTQYTGWTGATELTDYSVTDGSGGGLAVASASKVKAGLTSAVSATLSTASSRTEITIALEPDQSASSTYSYLGTKSMVVTPATTGTLKPKTNGNSNNAAVTPGSTYVFYYWVLTTGVSCYARVGIDYRATGGGLVSSASNDTYIALPQNAWTQVSRTITVPQGTGITNADLVADLVSNATTDRFFVDNVWAFQSIDATPVTFRVNNRGQIDAGPESNLFTTNPTCVLVRQGSLQGEDLSIRAVPGSIGMDQDMEEFATRVVLLGQSDGYQFSTGQADIGTISPGTNTFKDIHGNPLDITKMVSESETTDDNADARAEVALRKIITPHREVTLDTNDYDIYGSFDVGDYVYVYDPDSKLVDTANEVTVRGVRINPIKLQVTESEWVVTSHYSIAYRANDGTWYDLTDYLDPETDQSTHVTIGNFQRTLDDNLQDVNSRIGSNAAPDNSTPNAPSWVVGSFQTVAYLDKTGLSKAQQKLVWTTPTNEDGTTVTDGAFYEVQYKLSTGHLYSQTWAALSTKKWNELGTWAQPIQANTNDWETRTVQWGTNSLVINDLACGTAYDFRVRAVDTSNNQGDWSGVQTLVTSEDDISPSQPAAPVVAASLIAVQVTHTLGLNIGGTYNLERDIAFLEVHAEYEPGFNPQPSTKLGSIPVNTSMLDAQVPAVATFPISDTEEVWVKVIAVDRSGNTSSPSPAANVTAELIDDAHISDLTVSKVTAGEITADWLLAGTIKTGVDGQRVELNSAGVQAYNSDGDLTTNISSDPSVDRDFISWRGADGSVLARINSLGTGSFQNVDVANTLTVQGTDLLTEFLKRPKGVVAYGNWSTATYDITMTAQDSELGYMEISFIAEEDRMYRISISGEMESPDTANAQTNWLVRWTSDGSQPTINSPQLQNNQYFIGGTTAGPNLSNTTMFFGTFPAGQKIRLLWSMNAHLAKQTILASAGPSQFWVEDMGDISLFDNVAVLNDGLGVNGNTPDTGGSAGTFSIYNATWSRSYIGDNSLRPEYYSSRMYQGRYSSNFGQQKSLIGFDYNTIQSDLTNANVKKVELYLYAEHWYYDYGTAIIGTHNFSSSQGTWSSGSVSGDRVEVTNWNVSQGKWVDLGLTIGSELQNGASRGIAIGPTSSTDFQYYGYFTGASGTNVPKLRITYTK